MTKKKKTIDNEYGPIHLTYPISSQVLPSSRPVKVPVLWWYATQTLLPLSKNRSI